MYKVLKISLIFIVFLTHANADELTTRTSSTGKTLVIKEGLENGISYLEFEFDGIYPSNSFFWELQKNRNIHKEAGSTVDPLGNRDYWKKPLNSDTIIKHSPSLPDLKDILQNNQTSIKFRITDNTPNNWAKLYLIPEYLYIDKIKNFIEKNKTKLEKLSLLYRSKKNSTDDQFAIFNFFTRSPNETEEPAPKEPPLKKVEYIDEVFNLPVLIVTHASKVWDPDCLIKNSGDMIVSTFKSMGLPVVYLLNDEPYESENFYLEDKEPTYSLFSINGEHCVQTMANEVTIIGGNFKACLGESIQDSITRHFLNHSENKEPLTINLPMNAIYNWDTEVDEKNQKQIITKTIFDDYKKLGKKDFAVDIIKKLETSLFFRQHNLEIQGEFNTEEYAIKIIIDEDEFETVGTGRKPVAFHFWTPEKFDKYIRKK